MLRVVFSRIPTSLLNVACLGLFYLLGGELSPMSVILLLALALLADLLLFYHVSRSQKKAPVNLPGSSSSEKDEAKSALRTKQQATKRSLL
ncbi:protein of unknown function [Pseudodesulfovibrio profundus]|uniref:Uncharacterized protein n=1 Tax=Pseudodesulfovibrio profundus TaxID=57320 RepID=A0A2C8F8P9_9BACT|nr:hypothetical protein [Pseudodesulfovibrio profundus]SOB58229.1 protein of unknown function [Pseudodesulfovibrio profundus]